MADPSRVHRGPPVALPVTFTLDDRAYLLPAGDTADWLHALVLAPPGCWLTVIPGALAADDSEHLIGRLLDPDDALDLDDLETLAETVLGAVCGLGWYAACALAVSAYANWLIFDGWCVTVGLAPLTQPIGRLLAAVYAWRRSLCEESSDLTQLDAEIFEARPVFTASGADRSAIPPAWDDETESAAFMAAMTTGGRARGR